MAPYSVLVTGANRGIGLALIRELLKNEDIEIVIAGVRCPEKADELKSLYDPRLKIVQLDLGNDESIEKAVKEVKSIVSDKGLTVLINNAGVLLPSATNERITRKELIDQFQPNVFGAVLLTNLLIPLLAVSAIHHDGDEFSINRAAILNISSGAGSIANNRFDSPYGGSRLYKMFGYRITKAALNQITRSFAIDLVDHHILAVSFCPGPVHTDMHPEKENISELLEPKESAEALVNSFRELNESHNGNFYDRNLQEISF